MSSYVSHRSYFAGGAIPAKSLVKFKAGSSDTVLAASAATDNIIGISDLAAASGDKVDVAHGHYAEVVAGGSISAGDFITSDANGAAVTAAKVVGSLVRVAGMALYDASAGDIILVDVKSSSIQG